MKTEKFKSAAAIALAVMICATSLTACGSGGQKPKTGKDAPKQSQQVAPRKSDKRSSKDDKGSPSVKGTSGRKDAAKPPAADTGKNDAPAARPFTPDPVQKDPADTTVKDQKGDKSPAADKNALIAGKSPTVKSGK